MSSPNTTSVTGRLPIQSRISPLTRGSFNASSIVFPSPNGTGRRLCTTRATALFRAVATASRRSASLTLRHATAQAPGRSRIKLADPVLLPIAVNVCPFRPSSPSSTTSLRTGRRVGLSSSIFRRAGTRSEPLSSSRTSQVWSVVQRGPPRWARPG